MGPDELRAPKKAQAVNLRMRATGRIPRRERVSSTDERGPGGDTGSGHTKKKLRIKYEEPPKRFAVWGTSKHTNTQTG